MDRGREREPVDSYVTEIHGQKVTVKVYAKPAYQPDAKLQCGAGFAVDLTAHEEPKNAAS